MTTASSSELGFALVGCGRIAQRYIGLLGDHKVDGARLVAVCDVKPERAQAAGSKANVPHYLDMHEMLAQHDREIDVVCVLTESGLHAEHTVALARARKHVVVEKPMALRLDDADEMIRACEDAGVKLFVVKQNRFNLPVMKLRSALEEGRFGKLVMGTIRVRWCRTQAYYNQDAWRGTWALDGGVFTNQASHHIDLLEWMLGTAESAFARTRTALVDIETEDTGAGIVQFRNGSIGIIEATTAARPKDLEGSLSLLGERGMVEIGGFAVNQLKTWQFAERRPGDDDVIAQFGENPPDVYGFGHARYLAHVVDVLAHGKASLVDGHEGRKSLELITALYESVETGQEISLRFRPRRSQLGHGARVANLKMANLKMVGT
jgi:predicted dehydrogenase